MPQTDAHLSEQVFLAVETTREAAGLPWEIALTDCGGATTVWYLRAECLDLGRSADPRKLRADGYYDRHPQVYPNHGIIDQRTRLGGRRIVVADIAEVAAQLHVATLDRHIIGDRADFDTTVVAELMAHTGICPGWSDRISDITTLVEGHIRRHLPDGGLATLIAAAERGGAELSGAFPEGCAGTVEIVCALYTWVMNTTSAVDGDHRSAAPDLPVLPARPMWPPLATLGAEPPSHPRELIGDTLARELFAQPALADPQGCR